jgi:hypothetical protein
MDPKALREKLGLAEDASDEDVAAKLEDLNGRPTPEQIEQQVQTQADAKVEEAVAAAREDERQKIAAASANGETVTLDKASYEELKASADLGAKAHERLENSDREQYIAAAVQKGKFPPSRTEHYEALYKADPEGTRQLIDGLAEGVVPVDERGIAAAADDSTTPETTGWFPQLQKES